MRTIGVVSGTTRATRRTPVVAGWVADTVTETLGLDCTVIDLAEVGLPFLDEPELPARGGYAHAHTRAWGETVASYDGFVFVFPQYNWGYPAPLKNAMDFLYDEWSGKAAATVTFGSRGGNHAAAAFGLVLRGLHMEAVPGVELAIGHEVADIGAALPAYSSAVVEMGQRMAAVLGH